MLTRSHFHFVFDSNRTSVADITLQRGCWLSWVGQSCWLCGKCLVENHDAGFPVHRIFLVDPPRARGAPPPEGKPFPWQYTLLLPSPTGMSNPVPLRAIVGGVGVALASYNFLLLNGSVFGISGFIHCCFRGTVEPLFSVGGLVLGGAAIGALRSTVPPQILPNVNSLPIIATCGFLVGLGTKVGQTSRKVPPPMRLLT